MYLVDTSALIDIFVNRKGSEKIRLFLQDKEYSLSIISLYELQKVDQLDPKIMRFLNQSKILAITPESATISSEIFRNLRKKGEEINDADVLISGIALFHGLEIVTKDRDFEKISKVSKLKTHLF